jgi:hypothetical protein
MKLNLKMARESKIQGVERLLAGDCAMHLPYTHASLPDVLT